MEGEIRQYSDGDQPYDGAIHQITPGPVGGGFVPGQSMHTEKPQEVTIRRKPQKKQYTA